MIVVYDDHMEELPMFKEFPDLEKTASCNMCGSCCEAILTNLSWDDYNAKVLPLKNTDAKEDYTLWFIANRWIVIDRELALSINPNLGIGGYGTDNPAFKCSEFNPETRLCDAHESRPQICSGFPYYGKAINNQALLQHKNCSYWLDIPVEWWPSGIEISESPHQKGVE